MHYKARVKLVIGGWYKTKDGDIFKIIKCPGLPGGCSDEYKCKRRLLVSISQPYKRFCSEGAIKEKLIYYCTDEEIAYYSL